MAISARRLRERATEAHALAEDMVDENARAVMLRIAADYEKMAAHAESVEAAQAALKKAEGCSGCV